MPWRVSGDINFLPYHIVQLSVRHESGLDTNQTGFVTFSE